MKVLEEGWVLKLTLQTFQAGEAVLAKVREKPWDTKPDYSLTFTAGDLLVLKTVTAHRL